MKETKHILLLAALLLGSLTANAQRIGPVIGGICYSITSETSQTVEVVYSPSGYSGDIVIPEEIIYGKTYKVTAIGASAFENDVNVTSVSIPNSVTEIGNYAFSGCSGITHINIPIDAKMSGIYPFQGCTGELIMNSTRNISYQTGTGSSTTYGPFYGSKFTKVTIGDDVTTLLINAFWKCSSIKEVVIPANVTKIEKGAFYGCTGINNIICRAITPPTCNPNVFYEVNKSIPLYVPAGSVEAYKKAEYWKEFTNIQAIQAIQIPGKITINQYGSGTYCSEYALDFSEVEGLKAYAATGYKTSTGIVTLTRVMTSQPGMGLFLKGEEGEYIVPVLESTDENSLNMLVGLLESTELNGVSDDGLYYNYRYTIQEGDEEPMFYRVDDGYTHGAGKAYLQIPAAWMPSEARAISLRFDDEEGTTDIEDIESIANGQQPTAAYDLMGRKVANPQKGMVYIVNGKKVVW